MMNRIESLHTKHVNSDFDHLVSSGTLCIDDVSATVVHFGFKDHDL